MTKFSLIRDLEELPPFDQVVFGMISVFGRGNSIYFNFKNKDEKFEFEVDTHEELINFLKYANNMRVYSLSKPNKPIVDGKSPLDLKVDKPSAIVLALPKNSNMEFSQNGPSITTKGDIENPTYSCLRYARINYDLNKKIKSVLLEKKSFDGCKQIVFFSNVQEDSEYYSHGFNVHVDIIQYAVDGRRQSLPIIIDPEVKNPG